MDTFNIKVKEFFERVVKIEAESSNEAISKAKEMYRKEEIVLDYNDFVEVEFINVDAKNKNDEKDILIREVIDYLFEEEKKHSEELNNPNNHIFLKLERLNGLIN